MRQMGLYWRGKCSMKRKLACCGVPRRKTGNSINIPLAEGTEKAGEFASLPGTILATRCMGCSRDVNPSSTQWKSCWVARCITCNLLHRSDQNHSEKPRWSMICCYNAARNDPYKESHHPRYTPLHKVPDSTIKETGLRRFADTQADVAWLEVEKDRSARSLKQKP